jgi:SAM-dependent methyltransferase
VRQQIQDTLIDPLQFRFDVFPRLRYQPLPWIGYHDADRATGTAERWEVMRPIIQASGSQTALDIGCNVGFFSFAMAEMGLAVVGVDAQQKELRIAAFVRRRLHARYVGLLSLLIDPATVRLLPTADCTLLLSVWHHWVKGYGMDAATAMLATVWERTGRIMMFETGETEMPADFNLSCMQPSPREWIAKYLKETCNASIQCLGEMKAFAPGGSETRAIVRRSLFLVSR